MFYDTMWMMRQKFAMEDMKFTLGSCCQKMGVDLTDAHNAMNDVTATKELFVRLIEDLRSEGKDGQGKIQKKRIKFQF